MVASDYRQATSRSADANSRPRSALRVAGEGAELDIVGDEVLVATPMSGKHCSF